MRFFLMALSASCFAWVIAAEIRHFDPVVALFVFLALLVAAGKIAGRAR